MSRDREACALCIDAASLRRTVVLVRLITMRILHLSDIHYGMRIPKDGANPPAPRAAHAFIRHGGGEPDPAVLADILTRDAACGHPDIVVVSGDVGWSGSPQDYDYALYFFNALRKTWPSTPLLVIPGNHDVDRAEAATGNDPQAAFVAMLRQLHGAQFDQRYPLYATTDGGPPTRQQLVAFEYVSDELLVVGVNSAASFLTTDEPVFVEPGVLTMIADHIVTLGVPPTALRVFVVHHHLFPFAEPPWGDAYDASGVPDKADPTIVANSAKLQAWLADHDFHVVLHGHKHLSHGRRDVLWRHGDPAEGHGLFIVGAGSAGQHTPTEPLTYNVVTATRLAQGRWDVNVAVRKITDARGPYEATNYFPYHSQVGPSVAGTPVAFCAQRMDECHAAISTSALLGGPLRNFISVVEDNHYVHPLTTRIGERLPSRDEVVSSFRALHPEWDPHSGWDMPEQVDRALHNVPQRFQFEHGPRLFGAFGRAGDRAGSFLDPAQLRRLQPIRHAIQGLRSSAARGYVGMYNADIDVSDQQPLPGLMSVQFVPDGDHLDVVATFRKLELSFWWAVNMYELGELLRWAAQQDNRHRRRPRRITFFAALAEWKTDPEATFVTELDSMPLDELVRTVSEAKTRDDARQRLVSLLQDKVDRTNDVNIDHTGLERLARIVAGVSRDRSRPSRTSPITISLYEALTAAAHDTLTAREDREQRVRALLESARTHVQTAIDLLATQR